LLLIVLAAMAVLVVSDRAAAAFTDAQIRDRVESELAAHQVEYGTLAVDVAGVPFLTQAATGTLDKISIAMTDLRPGAGATGAAGAVTIASVVVVATGVQFNIGDIFRGEPTATAQELVGTAVITYETLNGLVDLSGMNLADVRFTESDGGIRFEALGALAPVQAVADVTVDEGLLRVRLRDAQFMSFVLPQLGTEVLNQILGVSIDLLMPELPLGLTLQAVIPGPDGLAISVVGRDVQLAASS
jgi:hypothetical protein